ncbi:MAG: replicative DNA helicase [Verrucomicrobiae bacterium]|nr:replicative DNA helicase [Verrucomicrobiae bacterium]
MVEAVFRERSVKLRPEMNGATLNADKWPVPYSLEAERGVLGSMLLSPKEATDEALERLVEEAFYDPRHQAMFRAMQEMVDANEPLDLMLLRERLKNRGLLDEIGGDGYLAQLVADVPTPANIFSYINLVRSKFLLRQVVCSCAELVQAVQEAPDDPGPVLDQAQAAFFKISEDSTARDTQPAKDLVMPVLKLIEHMSTNKGKVIGVPTGFYDLDSLTGGLHGGDMIVFAARPGVGKTSFALNIAEHATLEGGKAVGIFSLEMSSEQLLLRMLASRARVNQKTIRDGFISDTEFKRIAHAASEIQNAKLYLDETAGISLQQLRTKARRLKKRYDVDLIIIDYLQLIQAGGIRRNDSRQADVAEISGGIKAIAKELKIPVVVLCQLNREPEKRGGGQPRLSDLRESGAIEQDADIVGLLYRPELYRDSDEVGGNGLEGEACLDIQKHRNGPTQKIDLTFLKALTRFESRVRKKDVMEPGM